MRNKPLTFYLWRLLRLDVTLRPIKPRILEVAGGQRNVMNDSTVDAPHKEAAVDLAGWGWRGSGL